MEPKHGLSNSRGTLVGGGKGTEEAMRETWSVVVQSFLHRQQQKVDKEKNCGLVRDADAPLLLSAFSSSFPRPPSRPFLILVDPSVHPTIQTRFHQKEKKKKKVHPLSSYPLFRFLSSHRHRGCGCACVFPPRRGSPGSYGLRYGRRWLGWHLIVGRQGWRGLDGSRPKWRKTPPPFLPRPCRGRA